MRLLLDTHAFIWWDSEPEKLSTQALALCQDPENELILSVASLWEIQIKSELGRIKLKTSLSKMVKGQQQTNNLKILSVSAPHVYELNSLPLLHKDPFDRILVAQARAEDLRFITHDVIIKKYAVDVVW